MIQRILDRLLDWLLARCRHDSRDVAADILEGELAHKQVQLCRRCGAIRAVYEGRPGEWRRPQPMWCEPYNTEAMIRDAKAQP